jgi:hypothetical protein
LVETDCWLDFNKLWRDFSAVNLFRIEQSFSLQPDFFVFAGSLIEGEAKAGMIFEVPEAGHKLLIKVKAIDFLDKKSGEALLALRVHNENYLPGLGVGFTAELQEPGS